MKKQLTGQQIAEILNETRYKNSSDWVFVKSQYSSDYCKKAEGRRQEAEGKKLVQSAF